MYGRSLNAIVGGWVRVAVCAVLVCVSASVKGAPVYGDLWVVNTSGATAHWYEVHSYGYGGDTVVSSGSITLPSMGSLHITSLLVKDNSANVYNPFDAWLSTNSSSAGEVRTFDGPWTFSTVSASSGTLHWTTQTNNAPTYLPVTVTDTLAGPATAYFQQNGVTVYTAGLLPGQSASYTFVYYPGVDSITWGLSGGNVTPVRNPDTGLWGPPGPLVNNTNGAYSPGGGFGGGFGTNVVPPLVAQTNSNGPIDWSPLHGDTAAARDATLQAGFNAVVAQEQLLVGLVGELVMRTNAAGVVVVVTNSFAGQTNAVTSNEMWGLSMRATNVLVGMHGDVGSVGTNYGIGARGNYSDLGGAGAFTAPSVDGPGEFSFDLGEVGESGISFAVSSVAIPGVGAIVAARSLIKWCIYLVTLYMMFRWTEGAMLRLLAQRQAQGSPQAILGTNMSSAFALASAGVIATLVAGLPLGVAVYFGTVAGGVSANAGGFGSVSSVYWNMATYVVPLDTVVACFFTYCVFRWVIGVPLLIFGGAVILCLIA